MEAADALRTLLALAIGLVLGSVLPADLLARRHGVDIRARGDGNPGTVNAVRVLGWVPGLVTAVYDLSVGVAAVMIAQLLAVPTGWTYLAGIMVVVGHRFPLFMGLRGGGQGMAASAGLLVYGTVIALERGWITGADIALLVAVLAIAFALTRSDSASAVVMLPVLAGRLLLSGADRAFVAFMLVVAGYVWAVQGLRARQWLASRTAKPLHGRTHQ